MSGKYPRITTRSAAAPAAVTGLNLSGASKEEWFNGSLDKVKQTKSFAVHEDDRNKALQVLSKIEAPNKEEIVRHCFRKMFDEAPDQWVRCSGESQYNQRPVSRSAFGVPYQTADEEIPEQEFAQQFPSQPAFIVSSISSRNPGSQQRPLSRQEGSALEELQRQFTSQVRTTRKYLPPKALNAYNGPADAQRLDRARHAHSLLGSLRRPHSSQVKQRLRGSCTKLEMAASWSTSRQSPSTEMMANIHGTLQMSPAIQVFARPQKISRRPMSSQSMGRPGGRATGRPGDWNFSQ